MQRTARSLTFVIFLLLLGHLQIATAAIYKWVDENGQTHFSQTPPASEQLEHEQVDAGGSGDLQIFKDLPPSILSDYCRGVSSAASSIASRMKRGASATSALTNAGSRAEDTMMRQLVGFVFNYDNTSMSVSEIASLAHTQCMNGTYNMFLENYLKQEHPEEYDRIVRAGKGPDGLPGSGRSVSGTAWIVAPGYAVTNHHVVENSTRLQLMMHSGEAITVEVIASDSEHDLVLLKAEKKSDLPSPLSLTSRPERLGEDVFTIGFPFLNVMGKAPKVTSGIISSESGIQDDQRFYQISVPLQPGNSGGPLLNQYGQVVGVVTAKLDSRYTRQRSGSDAENVGYAVKSTHVSRLLRQAGVSVSSTPVISGTPPSLADIVASSRDSVMIVMAE